MKIVENRTLKVSWRLQGVSFLISSLVLSEHHDILAEIEKIFFDFGKKILKGGGVSFFLIFANFEKSLKIAL